MDTSSSADSAPNPLLGIGLKIVSVLVFVAMQTAIKAGAEGMPAGQIVFFRSFFALIPVLIYLAWIGGLSTAMRTSDLPGHILRGVIGVTSMGCGFYALTRLPYPEWIAISYGAPLLTVVFAAVFLRETVRAYRWFAVIVGLCGIAVVAVPNFTTGTESLSSDYVSGVIASFVGALGAAIAMIQIRRLVRKERTATIVVYFSLTSSGIAALTLPFGWIVPSFENGGLLVAAGLCGGIGQLLLTACYRYADTSTIAPFEYTSLMFAILIGYFVFGERVESTTLLGGAIVIGAGVFIIIREHRLGLERRKAKSATPPQS